MFCIPNKKKDALIPVESHGKNAVRNPARAGTKEPQELAIKEKGFLSANAEEYSGAHPQEISIPAGENAEGAASGIRDCQ